MSKCRRQADVFALLQAELVDGFLAWDFDADTAATFFAQQASSVSGLRCMHACDVYTNLYSYSRQI